MTASAVRDQAVTVADGRLTLRVKVAGGGPPLMFFHPLPGLTWDPLLDELAGRHTVYAPEHPGTSPGDPRAIDQVETFTELLLGYEEAIRALGLERPTAVGQSFGGMVAAGGCTGSRYRRSWSGAGWTRSSRSPTRRSSAAASAAAGSRCSTTAATSPERTFRTLGKFLGG